MADPTIGWRQLAVIDNTRATAFFHGDRIKSVHAKSQGTDCCAIGNIIRNTEIPGAMTAALEANPEEHLAERLLRALEADDAAGGEFRQIKSAALLLVHKKDFAYVDRVIDPDSVPYPEI